MMLHPLFEQFHQGNSDLLRVIVIIIKKFLNFLWSNVLFCIPTRQLTHIAQIYFYLSFLDLDFLYNWVFFGWWYIHSIYHTQYLKMLPNRDFFSLEHHFFFIITILVWGFPVFDFLFFVINSNSHHIVWYFSCQTF